MNGTLGAECEDDVSRLLRHFSAELTSGDRASIDSAISTMQRGSEVYIASIPSHPLERQVSVAAELSRGGLIPIPHIAARNIRDHGELDQLLKRFTTEAGVQHALVIGGDRDRAAGEFTSSRQILETGLLGKHGIRRISLSWYPEGHPRIADDEIVTARREKLLLAKQNDLDVTLVSQFCFEAAPILATARKIRAEGFNGPLRVGVAGPASRASLLKYAMICGVGASIRAVKERPGTQKLAGGETPAKLLVELARAQRNDSSLNFQGIHFFTFASLASTVRFVEQITAESRDA